MEIVVSYSHEIWFEHSINKYGYSCDAPVAQTGKTKGKKTLASSNQTNVSGHACQFSNKYFVLNGCCD